MQRDTTKRWLPCRVNNWPEALLNHTSKRHPSLHPPEFREKSFFFYFLYRLVSTGIWKLIPLIIVLPTKYVRNPLFPLKILSVSYWAKLMTPVGWGALRVTCRIGWIQWQCIAMVVIENISNCKINCGKVLQKYKRIKVYPFSAPQTHYIPA